MSFQQRLKERRESLGLSQVELAKNLGITKAAVSNYENGVSTPRADILFKVFDALKCDANFLFQDEMKELNQPDVFSDAEKKLIKKYRGLDTHGKKAVDWIAEHELNRLQGIESPIGGIIENATTAYTKIIPFPGKISAGLGVEAIPDYDTIAGPDAADFALLVDGDSMEPRYHSGQIIYIKSQSTIENGQIAVVQVQGPDDFEPRAYLKKIKIVDDTAELISLNKNYNTLSIPLNELTVLGTVI